MHVIQCDKPVLSPLLRSISKFHYITSSTMKHFSTRYLLLAIFLAMAWLPSKAQLTLVREVVAGSGGSGAAGGITIDYTIGEGIVETFGAGGILLTQGFHQPEVLPPLAPGAPAVMDFMLYPNPALTTVKISFN